MWLGSGTAGVFAIGQLPKTVNGDWVLIGLGPGIIALRQ
jgi:hypothetical protein